VRGACGYEWWHAVKLLEYAGSALGRVPQDPTQRARARRGCRRLLAFDVHRQDRVCRLPLECTVAAALRTACGSTAVVDEDQGVVSLWITGADFATATPAPGSSSSALIRPRTPGEGPSVLVVGRRRRPARCVSHLEGARATTLPHREIPSARASSRRPVRRVPRRPAQSTGLPHAGGIGITPVAQ